MFKNSILYGTHPVAGSKHGEFLRNSNLTLEGFVQKNLQEILV